MDAQDDGLHDDEEHGDAGGGAARGASCLNMNPMRMALPVAGGAPPRGGAQRTRWSATAEHVAFFDPIRIVAFLIANTEISCQSIFATFPSPRFPRATATLPQHGIAQFHTPCT